MVRQAVSMFAQPMQSKQKNREGFPSFAGSVEEDLVQTLMTNTLGNTYYADSKQLLAEAEQVMDRALDGDLDFFAKALVYARQRGYMRTMPIYGLVRLAGRSTKAFERVFGDVILTPNDLADFTAILKSRRHGEGGRAVKRAAGRWLVERIGRQKDGEADGQYWVLKYGAEKDAGAYSLRDMLQTYHPRVPGRKRLPLFDYILGGKSTPQKIVDRKTGEKRTIFPRDIGLMNFTDLPQIEQFELLKRAETDFERAEAIRIGRLPHEVATSFAGTSKEVWSAIVPNLPVFALLRNLATLERHGVLEQNKAQIRAVLTDPETIRKSKILPFRFVEAAKHVSAMWVQDALRDALELAFSNVPEIEGKTAVLLDVSPSMKPGYRSDDMMRHASIFAVALMKRTDGNGRLICFDADAWPAPINSRDSLLTQADAVARLGSRGGTNPSAGIDALVLCDAVDNIIVITDGQQNSGRPFAEALAYYRANVNSHVKCFVMDVSPNRDQIVPTDPQTRYIYGWSDQALQFVGLCSQGWGSQVGAIKRGAL